MIVHDLHVRGATCVLRPFETNSPLHVDPDGILSFPIPVQRFEPVARELAKIGKAYRRIQYLQPLPGLALEPREFADAPAKGKELCPLVPLVENHSQQDNVFDGVRQASRPWGIPAGCIALGVQLGHPIGNFSRAFQEMYEACTEIFEHSADKNKIYHRNEV